MAQAKDVFQLLREVISEPTTFVGNERVWEHVMNDSVINNYFHSHNKHQHLQSLLKKEREKLIAVKRDWSNDDAILLSKALMSAKCELEKLFGEYRNYVTNLEDVEDFPSHNLDCERLIAQLRDVDTREKHLSTPILEAALLYKNCFEEAESLSKDLTHNDEKILRTMARALPPTKLEETQIQEEIYKRKEKERDKQQQRIEKKRKRDEFLEDQPFVTTVEEVHRLSGERVKIQLQKHKRQ